MIDVEVRDPADGNWATVATFSSEHKVHKRWFLRVIPYLSVETVKSKPEAGVEAVAHARKLKAEGRYVRVVSRIAVHTEGLELLMWEDGRWYHGTNCL
jgi:hypothetical protein